MIAKFTRYTCDRCKHKSEKKEDDEKQLSGHMIMETSGSVYHAYGVTNSAEVHADWICAECTESFINWWENPSHRNVEE